MENRNNSPLLGYNTNVRHSGHVFHIQTEDSGLERPHVITHLFTSGTILSTKKTSYAELVESPDWEERVRQLMKDQHKAMFIELRDGVHDAVATRILGESFGAPHGGAVDSENKGASGGSSAGDPVLAVASESEDGARDDEPTQVRIIAPAAMNDRDATVKMSRPPMTPSRRPRSIFETPDASGSFGETFISDRSLDEVILTYLKDDLEE